MSGDKLTSEYLKDMLVSEGSDVLLNNDVIKRSLSDQEVQDKFDYFESKHSKLKLQRRKISLSDYEFEDDELTFQYKPLDRRKAYVGDVEIGGGTPVKVQSMALLPTRNIKEVTEECIELAEAGSELIRLSIPTYEDAKAIPIVKNNLLKAGYNRPLVACLHYNAHLVLAKHPECLEAVEKVRINPGNVGFGDKWDQNLALVVELINEFNAKKAVRCTKTGRLMTKAIRVGVNWGSLDESIKTEIMDINNRLRYPKSASEVERMAIIISAISSAKFIERLGFDPNQIILSCKVSKPIDTYIIHKALARLCNYAIHLGVTEAGSDTEGIVFTTAGLATLLMMGIGDTIRASLTPKKNEKRSREVVVCQQILQALGIRSFMPRVNSCPGCGRAEGGYFKDLAQRIQEFVKRKMSTWIKNYPGVEKMEVAVMGCLVNGPGESKHANIGLSLPGAFEEPVCAVYIDGKKAYTLKGDSIAEEFENIIVDYVLKNYGVADNDEETGSSDVNNKEESETIESTEEEDV